MRMMKKREAGVQLLSFVNEYSSKEFYGRLQFSPKKPGYGIARTGAFPARINPPARHAIAPTNHSS
jgi:hypothetical protein